MESVNNLLDELIAAIKDSPEYKKCISLIGQMQNSDDVVRLVSDIKRLQKEYVKSNYDSCVKKKLDKCIEEINAIPIYSMYNQNLEKVNSMIDYVRDSLNDYFYKLFNN